MSGATHVRGDEVSVRFKVLDPNGRDARTQPFVHGRESDPFARMMNSRVPRRGVTWTGA